MQRWTQLCSELGVDSRLAHAEGKRLIGSWDRLPRYYHDTTHLLACLEGLDQVRALLKDPHAAALALWFHDAVYWPRRHDNEDRSAMWAADFITRAGLPLALRDLVVKHILETKHSALPSPGDAQTVIDIDLRVLGQNEAVYAGFERNVRKEYRWVPWPDYAMRRGAVLQSFLDRARIYSTDWFFERYEATARHNLERTIKDLSRTGEIAAATRHQTKL